MSDTRELYQEVILDHYKHPRNCRKLDSANRVAHGDNPLCGDKIIVYAEVDGETITDVSFEGTGCAISTASASLMSEAVKGKTVEEARRLFERFREAVMSERETEVGFEEIGKLAVLSGVREYPARVKCATLSWHTLQAALRQERKTVTTE